MATKVVIVLRDGEEAQKIFDALRGPNARIVYRPLNDEHGWEETWPAIESIESVEIHAA